VICSALHEPEIRIRSHWVFKSSGDYSVARAARAIPGSTAGGTTAPAGARWKRAVPGTRRYDRSDRTQSGLDSGTAEWFVTVSF
jgi:hypothetical protein